MGVITKNTSQFQKEAREAPKLLYIVAIIFCTMLVTLCPSKKLVKYTDVLFKWRLNFVKIVTSHQRDPVLPNSLNLEIKADNGNSATFTPPTASKARSVSLQIGCAKTPTTPLDNFCKQATSKLPVSPMSTGLFRERSLKICKIM